MHGLLVLFHTPWLRRLLALGLATVPILRCLRGFLRCLREGSLAEAWYCLGAAAIGMMIVGYAWTVSAPHRPVVRVPTAFMAD